MFAYVIGFVLIGFVVGLITSDDSDHAVPLYLLIAIGWFFVWGPFAILAFAELIIGDMFARKIKGSKSEKANKISSSLGFIDADFIDISPKNRNSKIINGLEHKDNIGSYELLSDRVERVKRPSYYHSEIEPVSSNHSCSYDEWQRLGYQVKRGSKGYRRSYGVVFYRSQVVKKRW